MTANPSLKSNKRRRVVAGIFAAAVSIAGIVGAVAGSSGPAHAGVTWGRAAQTTTTTTTTPPSTNDAVSGVTWG